VPFSKAFEVIIKNQFVYRQLFYNQMNRLNYKSNEISGLH